MNLDVHPLGSTGLVVTAFCVGTSPLAGMAQLYGYDVPDDRAVATVEAMFGSRSSGSSTPPTGTGPTARPRARGPRPCRTRRWPRGGARDQGRPRPAHRRLLRQAGAGSSGSVSVDSARPGAAAPPARPGAHQFRGGYRDRRAGGGAGATARRGASRSPGGRRRPRWRCCSLPGYGRLRGGAHPQPVHLARPVGEALFRSARARGIGVLDAAPYGGGVLSPGADCRRRTGTADATTGSATLPRRYGRGARSDVRWPLRHCSSRSARRSWTPRSSACLRPNASSRP